MSWLRELRIQKGMTGKRICQLTGISESSYSCIERGLSLPKPETARALANLLGFDWERFWKEPLSKCSHAWYPVREMDLICGMHTCYIRQPGNGAWVWVVLLTNGRWQVEYGPDLDHTRIISDWPTLTRAKTEASRWINKEAKKTHGEL